MEKFKVAAVQMNALKDDLKQNVDVHLRFIEKAARDDCQLVTFPELSATAHYGDEQVLQFSEPTRDGPVNTAIADAAKKHKIVVGFGYSEEAHGTHYNSYALVGPNGLIGVQRKIHASADEYFAFRMGRSFETFDLGFCRIATLICYDGGFCESWRVIALKGVEVALLPHATRSGWGEKLDEPRQIEAFNWVFDVHARDLAVYAKTNGLFGVFCNQYGWNGHSTHHGGAFILDPLGDIVSRSQPALEELMLTAVLDPQKLAKARTPRAFQLRTRRPEVYGELTMMM